MFPILAIAQYLGEILDLVGVMVIVSGALASVLAGVRDLATQRSGMYKMLRKNLGRSILLGLEFLVAGDIIRSVTGTPDFTSVGVLVVVVLVRYFLSVTFEMEIDGHWPWQHH